MRPSRGTKGAACVLAACLLGVAVPGCTGDFHTARETLPRGSLGREMYTLVCDRVGAQALREDITGASYHDVCHANPSGTFADRVDVTKLPPLDPAALDVRQEPVALQRQQRNRDHRVARIEALARRRDDLVDAFETAFANEVIGTKDLANADPKKSCGPPPGASGEADLRTEVSGMLGRMTDLYNDDTLPYLTRALSRVMTDVERSPSAREALTRFDARRGYRPGAIAMGVARPALSYPRLPELANAVLRLLSADTDPLGIASAPGTKAKDRAASDRIAGKGHAPIVDLLSAMHEELRTSKALPITRSLTTTTDSRDATLVRLSRPRGNLEIARTIFLHEDEAFSAGETARWALRRDTRGFARVALTSGKVPGPFVDLTGPDGKPDGLPDVDDLGRFITQGGEAPPPFRIVGTAEAFARDDNGRALLGATPAYEYVDLSRTFLSALTRDLIPLLEPDPKRAHETVMDLVGGFAVVSGERDERPESTRIYTGKTSDDTAVLLYRGYRADTSPLLDLVHAFGQVLADENADDTLALVQRLVRDKPQVFARLVGVGLAIKKIADAHPEATIPEASTLWDEMLDVLVKISQRPKLVEDIIRAFGDDATLDFKRSATAYMTTRDELTYDRNNLNGPAFNITTGKVDALVTPVDREKPDTGVNRSVFQRFLQTLHDANGMSICTKRGAVAHIVWRGLPLDFPSFPAQAACVVLGADPPADPLPLCGMLRIKNIAEEIVNAVLGAVNLDIRDECLRRLVASPLTGIVGGADAFLEEVSGIQGFNTKPTVPGINRLIFFDLPHDGSPGDTRNKKTLDFLKDVLDPPPTLACPQLPFTDKDGTQLNLRQCASFKDSIRGRDANALFPMEQLGFIEASKPLARAFHQNDANLLFVDLFDTLHRHWGSTAQSADECDPSAPKTNVRWCSQDGAVSYEPLIAEVFGTDLLAAMHDAVKELETITISHCNGRDAKGSCLGTTQRDGVKVLAETVNGLVDPARNRGVTRRNGDASVVRNDGTPNPQVTPIYLLIDALKGFDARLAAHKAKHPDDDRLPAWRRGRSQLVDQLFAVSGSGKASKLANPTIEKVLPIIVATLRSQLQANCPDPTKCTWARAELESKMREMVSGPTFAATLDVLDTIRADEPARTELERFLVFLFQSGQSDASEATLTALADMLQVFEDDGNMTALLNAIAEAAGPEVVTKDGRIESRGMLLAAIEVLSRILGEVRDADGVRLCGREIDPNHTLAVVLRRLVSARPDGKPAPIEVIIDVIADVNRARPEDTTKLDASDYASIAHEVSDFCTHPSRGLEQMYAVIKRATQDL